MKFKKKMNNLTLNPLLTIRFNTLSLGSTGKKIEGNYQLKSANFNNSGTTSIFS